jgi:hypothetical protein
MNLQGDGWGDTLSFWTSGSNDGINCEKTWGWCPESTAVVSDLWNANEPNSPFGEQCASWQYNPSNYGNTRLFDAPCTSQRRFICEVILKRGFILSQLNIS